MLKKGSTIFLKEFGIGVIEIFDEKELIVNFLYCSKKVQCNIQTLEEIEPKFVIAKLKGHSCIFTEDEYTIIFSNQEKYKILLETWDKFAKE